MGISELFGYTPNLSTLSNMLGDQVVDTGADVIGSIKSQDTRVLPADFTVKYCYNTWL